MIFLKNSLKHNILFLCLSLVMMTTVIVLFSFWWFGSRYTNQHIASSASDARHVFQQYSTAKSNLLRMAAEVLTADFGFKQAVASGDSATITSVLDNHGQRINADLMLIIAKDGELISSNSDFTGSEKQFSLQIKKMVESSGRTQYIYIDNKLYQAVLLPIMAPRVIAYTVVGFLISKNVTDELKSLTGLDVSFYLDTKLVNSSLDAAQSQISFNNFEKPSVLDRSRYSNSKIDIPYSGDKSAYIVLSYDLSEYYEKFDRLILAIIILTVIILICAFLAAIVLANSLTKPLAQLTHQVDDFAKGNYSIRENKTIVTEEIKALFSAFTEMGKKIEIRENQILFQAQHDLLTNLLNRNTMLNRIDYFITENKTFALLTLHIKALQSINDNLGFQTGDTYLKTIADRLRESLPSSNALHARLGGDSFISLIWFDENNPLEKSIDLVTRSLARPVQIQSITLNTEYCAGMAIHPKDGSDGKALVRRATIAVEAARKESLNIRYYKAGEDEAHLERINMLEDLKNALLKDDGQLYMNYQPKLNLKTGQIEKLEALIRWNRPDKGFVPPDIFVELAEQTGLIIDLTQWVAKNVIQQIQIWRKENIDIQVAINISAQDLVHPEFIHYMDNLLSSNGINQSSLTIELTERDLMSNETKGIEQMNRLRDSGYVLSVDDYGIGQSSLSKLKRLPVHELKIDKSFILKLNESSEDQMIVRSTVDLGHNLGLKVVAEGVENAESLTLLKEMGCDYIQGYFLSKPILGSDITTWLNEYENFKKQA